MGKQPLTRKVEIVDQVQSLLANSQMVLIVDYQGLTVAEMNTLRSNLREADSSLVVVKNTLMRRAIADQSRWRGINTFLSGQTIFILIRGDIKKTIKIYQDFQKKAKKTEFKGAAIDGLGLNLEQAQAIADLPPKEVLLAQVAGGINAMSTRLAVSLNALPTQVARVVNEVPSSLGRAIKAVAEKQEAA